MQPVKTTGEPIDSDKLTTDAPTDVALAAADPFPEDEKPKDKKPNKSSSKKAAKPKAKSPRRGSQKPSGKQSSSTGSSTPASNFFQEARVDEEDRLALNERNKKLQLLIGKNNVSRMEGFGYSVYDRDGNLVAKGEGVSGDPETRSRPS